MLIPNLASLCEISYFTSYFLADFLRKKRASKIAKKEAKPRDFVLLLTCIIIKLDQRDQC